MNVLIRPETAHRPDLMQMLQHETTMLMKKLYDNKIILPDNAVKIWIKEFSETKLFPKIEIDINGQELQYDLNHDGTIREVHFKTFIRQNGRIIRQDIDKMNADKLLIRIDDIIRFNP